MDKSLIYDYMFAKRGKKNMSIVLKRIITEYPKLNNKYLKIKDTGIDSIANKLNITGLEVEMLARANKHNIIYTVKGNFIQREY